MSTLHEVGEKISIKGGDLKIEVLSFSSGAQEVPFDEKNCDDTYEVLLNGHKMKIKGRMLDILSKARGAKFEYVKPGKLSKEEIAKQAEKDGGK